LSILMPARRCAGRNQCERFESDDDRARIAQMSANLDLGALGADTFPHLAGSLAAHLVRTEEWLRRFGARDALCRAGRHHAVYGTAGIHGALVPLAQRRAVAAAIGDEAETIVYRYASCDRDRFHPRLGSAGECLFADRFEGRDHAIAPAELRDFCELTLANELDLVATSPAFRRKHRDDLLELAQRMRAHATDAAYAAMCAELG
jgi:hypothetical protein